MSPATQSSDESAGTLPTVDLAGIRIHRITEAQCIEVIVSAARRGRGGICVTPNLDHLCRTQRDPEYRALVERADLVVADGMPLVWASRILGRRLPERVAGSNLVSSLSRAAGETNLSIYLLGGDPGTAEAAGEVLCRRCPGLVVAGTDCPPLAFEEDPAEMRRIRDSLVAANPNIVYVALGSPKQERLMAEFRASLPAAWWLGVGISFSFLCGEVRRAPRWMQRSGLEWTHRLAQEPRRLARRYLLDGVPFAVRLLSGCAYERLTRRARPRAES